MNNVDPISEFFIWVTIIGFIGIWLMLFWWGDDQWR